MTIEEINMTLKNLEDKIAEVKSLMSDIDICQNDKSKTILLAAASKLASALVPVGQH